MNITLIRFFGFFLMLLGFAGAPNTAIGQVSGLETTLVSLGYKVEQKDGVEITASEKSEFNLKGKLRYVMRSVKPVIGERRLYYRFTVDVEAYQNESDAQKRLDRIIATPPGADSKMEPEQGFREGFRRENKVYVVSTDVYKFVLDKDLTRLREKLEKAVSERIARKRGIDIGYIPARRNEAVEASRLLQGDDFRVTLVEYPETSVSAVELIHYPSGSASEARKIADILKCCLGTVAVKESPYSPARMGVDYFLGYLGRSPSRPRADNPTVKVAATCKAAKGGYAKYISYIVTFDVLNVLEGEYRESEVAFDVRPWADIANAIKINNLPRGSISCDQSIQVILTFEVTSSEKSEFMPPTLLKGFSVVNHENARYFASPQAAIPVITELLRKEDWTTLTSYYDFSNLKILRSELESGRFFIHDKRPEGSHPGLPWKYKHPFAPGFKFAEVKETDDPHVVRVLLKIEIDEGGGMVQRGFSEFMMRKSDKGFQLLPPDGAPAQTDRAEYAEVLRRIAVKIEALGRTYPHLAKFSVEKNVRGLKLEPELRILYYNGVRLVPNPRYRDDEKVSKLVPAYAEADGIELILNLMTEEQADSGQKVVSRKTMIGNRVVDLIVEGENTIAIKEITEKIRSIIKDEKAYYESRHDDRDIDRISAENLQSGDCEKICRAIADDIESLKSEFPQLKQFKATEAIKSGCSINYQYKVHRSSAKGGWRSGFPEPDEDGIVFYIGLWDEKSMDNRQINTQPAQSPWYIDRWKVTYLMLEGDKIKSVDDRIYKILESHGLFTKKSRR